MATKQNSLPSFSFVKYRGDPTVHIRPVHSTRLCVAGMASNLGHQSASTLIGSDPALWTDQLYQTVKLCSLLGFVSCFL